MKFLIEAVFSLVIITGCHQAHIKHIQYPDTVIDPEIQEKEAEATLSTEELIAKYEPTK